MDLVGIENQNEYYTNHYFTSIFKDNAEDTIKGWKNRDKEEKIILPWKRLRDISRQYYRIRDRYQHIKNENSSKEYVQELADLYLAALGYEKCNSAVADIADGITVPVYHEETKPNGAPLLWAFLCVAEEKGEDILQSKIFEKFHEEEENENTLEIINDDILSKLFFAGEEAPRFILLFGINQIALVDRNKWNEKRYLQFIMEDIYSRHEETTFMAMTVLLHKESLCPVDGTCVLDNLDENSHKHSAGISDALKYALRESIEILGNEVIYDMKYHQGIDLDEKPIDASELTLECLRYMYRFLFMLFIESRPELGYAPMKSQTYVQGYSLEGVRDVCDRVKEESDSVSEGYYIDDTISELFKLVYEGYPGDVEDYKKALEQKSPHDVFIIESLKAHIFDPDYTKLITKARLRNEAMLQIVDLMSISRPTNSRERRGRISYSALGINQMGAVYEALLSYRGFIAEDTLYEVKRAGTNFNELDVGYFVKEEELVNYDEETERVRYEKGDRKGQLRTYEKGTFIYRLAGREREKSASYYTPEVLTKCLVKYALKELLKDKTADEILNLTICEPAMGSAAFLNEAINQLAEEYLNKKQEELGENIPFDKRFEELQKVKMFIADRNVYGVDLNPIAVELAEVSLWLNTIYKGAYVPWFGTQLVCGNSLIGARRQVYLQSQLEDGKWWEKAPNRINPGEERTRKGQHEKTKGIYHFLLGDAEMANYSDKVIKRIEADKIKKINVWRKEFTSKYDENDIQTLLSLSQRIDDLWKRTVELRKKVERATFEPLSMFGHDETNSGSHITIREKDAIYKQLFKSEHMNNAGPYARLKAAMDYWCALWFWPIDKVDLLPDRQTFFFEMSLLLEGTLNAVSTSASGQVSFIDSAGNASYDEDGNLNYIINGSQIALEFQAQYATLGRVDLDELREKHKRLAIVNQIAEEQKFQHWELEFADVFYDKGGFDLIVGNPPWVKALWDESDILSELNPIIEVKSYSADEIGRSRDSILDSDYKLQQYIKEYVSAAGVQNYLGASNMYPEMKKISINLYKNFIPLGWWLVNEVGCTSYVHPDSVYDDPKGAGLRKEIYKRLVKHFHFRNENKIFQIHNTRSFSINIYRNGKESIGFDTISNLFAISTVDDCYENDNSEVEIGIKDSDGKWNLNGNKQRIIHVDESALHMFGELYDGTTNSISARLPVLQCGNLMSVLIKMNSVKKSISEVSDSIFATEMWNERGAQGDGTLKRSTVFPEKISTLILSGAHVGIANGFSKTPRRICNSNKAFDEIDVSRMRPDYLPRTNYIIGCNEDEYVNRLPKLSDGTRCDVFYRMATRKMVDPLTERTLIAAIIPPKVGHINGLISSYFGSNENLLNVASLFVSIPYDFFIKVTGKTNLYFETQEKLPLVEKYKNERIARMLLLSCVNGQYDDLWKQEWKDDFGNIKWLSDSSLLRKDLFGQLTKKSNYKERAISEYERHQLLVELDVYTALEFELSLEEVITIYKIQFPVLFQYENDTFYDVNGKVVFSAKNRGNLICSRKEWEEKKAQSRIIHVYEDDTDNNCKSVETVFDGPFIKVLREQLYKEAWYKLKEV